MSEFASLAACAILAALGVWLLGGIVLRAGGAALAIGGLLIVALTGSLATTALAVVGAVTWLAGHWLFAFRHHYFRSPLARRMFLEVLPARFDPMRKWGIPNIPPESRR
jgi:hypothetical protein